MKVVCQEGGQWEELGCVPVACPALPDVFQGMYTCTNHLHYDSVCTLQCSDDTAHNVSTPVVEECTQMNVLLHLIQIITQWVFVLIVVVSQSYSL